MDGFLELDGCLRTGDLASFGSVGGMEDWPRSEASSHLEVCTTLISSPYRLVN